MLDRMYGRPWKLEYSLLYRISSYIGPKTSGKTGDLNMNTPPGIHIQVWEAQHSEMGWGLPDKMKTLDRKDQLVFEKEQEEPLILLGPVSATLWLSSNASCTDFMVGLQDVFPDGKIINIQEGIARVEFNANRPRKTEISVWATGYQFQPGHHLGW